MIRQAYKIGKVVRSLVAAVAADKGLRLPCHPLMAPSGTATPFVTYGRDGMEPERTKDGSWRTAVTVDLTVVDLSYAEGLDIAAAIAEAVESADGDYDGVQVREGGVVDAYEDVTPKGVYIQGLTVKFVI